MVGDAGRRARAPAAPRSPRSSSKLQDDLVPLIIAETGATAAVGSRMQVPVAIERFERYARDAGRTSGSRCRRRPSAATPLAPGALMGAHVNRQPVGAVACISPYNFPLTNIAGKIAPALAVGCTVVVKPAPQDPLAILMLARDHARGRVPAGCGQRDHRRRRRARGRRSPTTPDIDMVVVHRLHRRRAAHLPRPAATTMKRMLLELGGKGAASCSTTPTSTSRVTAIAQRVDVPLAARSAPRRRVRSCTAAATTSWSTSSRHGGRR